MLDQIEKAKKFIEAKKELKNTQSFKYPFDLQFFAKGGEDDDLEDEDLDDEEEDQEEDEEESSDPSLEQMLKDNPALRKQFNSLFKDRFNKRLKGIDLKQAKKALKMMQEKEESEEEDQEDNKTKADEIAKKAQKLDTRIKRTAVKEYAVDNDLNPKLLSRLIDLNQLDLDDEGEVDPDDLEELVDELTEEFPELFRTSRDEDQDQDEDEDQEDTRKARSHKVGSRKKTNNPKAKDLREAGRQKALERAKRKGLIKD